jgi:hypothetical protein
MPCIKTWLVQREENASESFDLFLVSTSNSILPGCPFLTTVLTKAVASSFGDSEGNGEIGDASLRDFWHSRSKIS